MFNHLIDPPTAEDTTRHALLDTVTDDDGGLKRRQCFAIVAKLESGFKQAGISNNAFWCWALATRDLPPYSSRSEMSTRDWTHLAARLQTAQQNHDMFNALVKLIKKQADCRVVRRNPDYSHKKVFHGLFEKKIIERAAEYADLTGCIIYLFAYGECEIFEPAELKDDPNMEMPPICQNPRRYFKD